MSAPNRQIVRPAGAGHETLYVLLLCLLILGVAAGVVSLHRDTQETHSLASHQLDARRDLTAAEQGIYADLRVTLDEIRLLATEQQTPVTPQQLGDEGFAPFAQDASSVSRGGHTWQMVEQSYLGLSQAPNVAGSFLMRVDSDNQPDIWINRSASIAPVSDLDDKALVDAGWKQVVAQFDAGVTRQHPH
ncbi:MULTISPECIES: DUF6162 family protein [Pseudomonas syringae group]|uniref:Chemotaxis methyl-accepting receptor Tar-related ligand-binding domain-containing protein n=2 Tax=Pseudomonas syringae group TaxID=136849 RepID=A0A2K4WX71_PSESX|nr:MULTISPECIES: DUF6162 family protein [Pseudomonas syringae group]AVB14283.1 hypothetical protein BKM19_012295 [Pseudomonas amygdali pv. morsprunorum]KWS53611.1 hypothetical protein AL056_08780 [Pseudomonas amygdali pv. morsprunorum]KWS60530.1 hypothetical protein AL054_08540 [Pseudomonas amygdali pv. morsprunorum]MBD1107751.1 hypothetical protein [Pseudomonas amygdali pv. morsprunorum]MDT3222802.1 DUF6162 family protein [Pseudomonas amygdali pv. morsprunorum]